MSWQDSEETKDKRGVPQGLWVRCPGCQATIFRKEAQRRLGTCPECDYHWAITAQERIAQTLDEGTFEEWDADMIAADPLNFRDRKAYKDRLVDDRKATGLRDAIVSGCGRVRARKVAFAVTDSRFIMGSMGSVVGEKLTRAIERAQEQNLPLIVVSGSGGGARMHEGILSLMQMAKTSGAVKRHSDAGHLYIAVLTDPTTGGVTASFAMEADITLAEPGALIGFAGPRVIEQTIRQKLPEGFQKAEFQQDKGFVDCIADRRGQREMLMRLMRLHGRRPVHDGV